MDDVRVQVGLDTTPLERGLRQAERILSGVGRDVQVGLDTVPLERGLRQAMGILERLSGVSREVSLELDLERFRADVDETRRILEGLEDEEFARVMRVELEGVEDVRRQLRELDPAAVQDRRAVAADMRVLRQSAQQQISQRPASPWESIAKPILNTFAGDGLGGLTEMAMGQVTALGKVGIALSAVQKAFAAMQAVGLAVYRSLVLEADRYERTLISTAGSLAATTEVLVKGVKVENPGEAMDALAAPLERAMGNLRVRGANLVTDFAQQTQVFEVVAGQLAGIGGSLDDAVELTLQFAAGLDALGLPAHQARQEINSLLTATADQNSVLAQKLFGSTQAANTLISQWKQQGTLIPELTKRLEAYGNAAQRATQTVSGITANIGDQLGQIQLTLGQGLTAPVKAALQVVLDILTGIQSSSALKNMADLFREVGESAKRTAEFLGEAFGQPMQDSVTASLDVVTELGRLLTNLLAPAVETLVKTFSLLLGSQLKTFSVLVDILGKVLKLVNALVGALRDLGKAFGAAVLPDWLADFMGIKKEQDVDAGGKLRRRFQKLGQELTGESDETIYARRLNEELEKANPQNMEQVRAVRQRVREEMGMADTDVQIRSKTLTDEQYSTPERLLAEWNRAWEEIGHGYQDTMQDIQTAQMVAERTILESVKNTAEGERQAQRRRTQYALEEAERKLQVERSALQERLHLAAEAARRASETEQEIARLKEDGIQEQEENTLDALQSRLDKERAAERRAAEEIAQIRKRTEELTLDMVRKRREAEREAREEAILGIQRQAQETAHAYDLQAASLQAMSQSMSQQAQALQAQSGILQERLRGLQLDKEAALEKAGDDPEERARINARYVEKELAIKRELIEIEVRLAELAARRAEIEARRAALQASKELQEAQFALEAAQKQGDEDAIRAAENRLELARESLNLAQEQAAAAKQELQTTKELGNLKRQNAEKEAQAARRAAKKAKELAQEQKAAQEQSDQTAPRHKGREAAGDVGNTVSAIEKMGTAASDVGGEYRKLQAESAEVTSALHSLRGELEAGLGQMSVSKGGWWLEALKKAGSGMQSMGGGLPGGWGMGNMLGRDSFRNKPAGGGGGGTNINVQVTGSPSDHKVGQDITLAVMDALGRA